MTDAVLQQRLFTRAGVNPAPVANRAVLDPLYAALAEKDLLPERYLFDSVDIEVDVLVAAARHHGVDLIGPVPKDNQWQARTKGGFTIEAFQLDLDR